MKDITLYSISYYEKSIFKGSYRGMNFRLSKGGDEDNKVLVATAWKGPYILEKSEEEPVTQEFEFSDKGIAAADEWLTEQQRLLMSP